MRFSQIGVIYLNAKSRQIEAAEDSQDSDRDLDGHDYDAGQPASPPVGDSEVEAKV